MRIAILGSGSLGSLYAALLSRVEGVELLIHGRGTHGAHMAAEGLHLEPPECSRFYVHLNPKSIHPSWVLEVWTTMG